MKVLLISDSAMNINGGGFSQTLYNIFSFVRPADLLLITSLHAYNEARPSPPFDNHVLTYNLETVPVQRNVLGKFVNTFIRQFNYSFNSTFRRFKRIQKAIKTFDADVVIVAPNGEEGIFIYGQLKNAFSRKKTIPYFMDDWLCQSRLKWIGGNIHSLAKSLLANTAWMMISESLGNILTERYSVKPSKLLAIHNPVDVENLLLHEPTSKKRVYTIAYAGSLWQMHFDAFLVIAKAIRLMQKEVGVNLVVYTTQSNWEWRKQELISLNIEYRGHVPYAEIHSTLSESDCFLLTSSFLQEWQTHTKASVQTKITDYLKAGRLIISCGPSYSANHQFLKMHNCGVCIETNDVQEAATELEQILDNIEAYQICVQRGYITLRNELSFDVVHGRLKKFLAA